MGKTAFWTCIFGIEATAIVFMGFISLPRRFTNLKPTPWFDLEIEEISIRG
jgi:hypothetical protein